MALEGIVQTIVFPDKASVWILALTYDESGVLVSPTNVKVSVTDPDGTLKVDEQIMTLYDSNTGIYEYFYHKGASSDVMASGQWTGEILVIDGTGATAVISSQNFAFSVE